MKIFKFKNYEDYDKLIKEILEEIDKGSTVLTFSSRAARRLIFLYRKNKLEKKEKVWLSPRVYSFNFFVDLLFDELLTNKRIMSFEDSILLWHKTVKENYKEENLPFVELALEYKRHYEFAEKNKITLQKSDKDFFELRNSIFETFEKYKKEQDFLSYSEEISEIEKAIEEKDLTLTSKIILVDTEDYSPLEKDFIQFISGKTEVVEYSIEYSSISLENEVSLYENPQSEVEATINKAIELWEKGERSIAIVYFDDSYKNLVETILLNYENTKEDAYRYNFEDSSKISDFVSFKIVSRFLTLSQGNAGDSLLDVVSLPFFKPKISIENENLLRKIKLLDKESLNKFKNDFRFGEELDNFLEDKKIKISSITDNLKTIIDKHFVVEDGSQLSRSFNEIVDFLDFFEAGFPEAEITPSEFEKILSASIQNRKIGENGSELCGIQVLSYKNCAFQNFDNLFLLGANLSVLPKPIPIYPYFSGEEKKGCLALDIKENFKKEENFLKKVLATNKNVYISRAKKEGENPFIASPLLKGAETGEKWNKYDFDLNKFLLHKSVYEPAKQEYIGKFKDIETLSLEIPNELRVTIEAMDIFSCPFKFFAKHYLKIKEPEEAKIFLDIKDLGSFFHSLAARIGENIKEKTAEEEINTDEIKQIALSLIEEKKEDLTNLQQISLESFLLGKDGRKGIIDDFVEFEKKRIREGWKIEELEKEYSKVFAEFDNSTFKGRMDRIESSIDGQKKRVIDFKTNANSSLKPSERFQLEMYKRILSDNPEDQANITTMIARLFDLSNTKPSSAQDTTIANDYNRFKQCFEKVKQGNFEPAPQSKNECEYCNFNLLCHIETKEENENGEDQESFENE